MNGCCNRYHPLQALTDLMTLQEYYGKLEGLRLKELRARARSEECDDGAMAEAMDSDDPKASLIALIVEIVSSRGPLDRMLSQAEAALSR